MKATLSPDGSAEGGPSHLPHRNRSPSVVARNALLAGQRLQSAELSAVAAPFDAAPGPPKRREGYNVKPIAALTTAGAPPDDALGAIAFRASTDGGSRVLRRRSDRPDGGRTADARSQSPKSNVGRRSPRDSWTTPPNRRAGRPGGDGRGPRRSHRHAPGGGRRSAGWCAGRRARAAPRPRARARRPPAGGWAITPAARAGVRAARARRRLGMTGAQAGGRRRRRGGEARHRHGGRGARTAAARRAAQRREPADAL